jgi:cytidylate kinase
MIITISGSPGSGKSTLSRALARRLGFRHYSVGDLMRTLAKKRGTSLLELSREAERDSSIDRELDRMQEELGKKQDNFIMDSRLGFHFIPQSIKIFLEVDEREAASRIFHDLNREERENTSLEKTLENIRRRKASERLRYRKYYGLDCYRKSQYDLVFDTTGLSKEQTLERITESLGKN